MITTARRGQQALVLLLSAIPYAERMLLYNLTMAALAMIPVRGIREMN